MPLKCFPFNSFSIALCFFKSIIDFLYFVIFFYAILFFVNTLPVSNLPFFPTILNYILNPFFTNFFGLPILFILYFNII